MKRDSIYVEAAKEVIRQGGFKLRHTHHGLEIRDRDERHLHTYTDPEQARQELDRLNGHGPVVTP